jgi:hypothetical protein
MPIMTLTHDKYRMIILQDDSYIVPVIDDKGNKFYIAVSKEDLDKVLIEGKIVIEENCGGSVN